MYLLRSSEVRASCNDKLSEEKLVRNEKHLKCGMTENQNK